MSEARKITAGDLAQVKGLGEAKAVLILEALDTGKPEDLTEITGVSERLAKEVAKLIKSPDKYKPEPPTPRKAKTKAEVQVDAKTKRITKKATASSNGSAKVSAGDVRRFARDAEKLGFKGLASDLRDQVAPLLDDEKVSAGSLKA